MVQGYVPEISLENNRIKLRYHECPRQEKHLENVEKQKFVQSLHMPREIHEATFDKIYLDEEARIDVFAQIKAFFDQTQNELPSKGLYLYGKFGVGKLICLRHLRMLWLS